MSPYILLVIGLGVLLVGAETLVRGASSLARSFGVSALVVGLTVVSLGTSSPEIAVSLGSALTDRADVAVGNVIGSNIFNVLLILGLSAALSPLVVSRQLVRLDVPVMVGVAALLYLLAWDGQVTTLEGAFLLLLGCVYTVVLLRHGDSIDASLTEVPEEAGTSGDSVAPTADSSSEAVSMRSLGSTVRNLLTIAVGLALLLLGANWLVDGATEVARELGVSELIIGLTVVSAGTSLPELATSALAAFRGERDIAVGNVVGSNIMNVLVVLGVAAAAAGGVDVAPAALAADLPVLMAVSIACLPIFLSDYTISRGEGFVFLGYYVAYILSLTLDASGHDEISSGLNQFVLFFALPLTALTLVLQVVRQLRSR